MSCYFIPSYWWLWYAYIRPKENDLILDPFAGTGTTLLACKQLHRRGVGYEKNPDYYTIADKRLKQTTVKGFFETLTPSN